MIIIPNCRPPRTFPDPVSAAQGLVGLATLVDAPVDGVRFTTLRTLSAAAQGPGTRKRAGYFRNDGSRAIVKYLDDRDEVIYFPHAEAEMQSHIENRRLRVPINKHADVLAMLPGDHVVAVASKQTDVGRSLVDGRTELVYDRDGDRPHDIMERVQRANALDVIAVLGIVYPSCGK